MRQFLLLAPLGMLMLTSCGPAGGSSDAGNNRPGDKRDWGFENIVVNEAGNAQVAAQDSVGKPPAPQRLNDVVDDICPVHHEKMKIRQVPIVFQDTEADATDPAAPSAMSAFPFAAEKIVSAGNPLLPGESPTARVYQCASCIAAKSAAGKMRVRSMAHPAPE